jgi:F-type H+-transporting ATPase subunit epsilon
MSELEIEILAPDRPIAEVSAVGVTVPGTLGYLTILPGHTPLVSELDTGELLVQKADESLRYFISGGYVEVANDKLKVLADVVEIPDGIDPGRAEKSRNRALERLEEKAHGLDAMRAQAALKRADSRLNMAKALGGIAKHT